MSRKTNAPLILGGLTAAALLFLYLRNKARAGQNLRVEPVDASLNSSRTRQSLYTRLYYTVKLRLVNDEPAAVVVRALNLKATANGRDFGSLVSKDAFTVPAKSAQVISLDASVATLGALGAILDILRGGRSVDVTIAGYADTDLGRVNVNYETELSASGINGRRAVNGPPTIEKLKRGEYFGIPGKKTVYVYGGYNRATKRYEAQRADDMNAFRQFKKGFIVNPDIDF